MLSTFGRTRRYPGIDRNDTLLYQRFAKGGRENGKITPFGVTADTHRIGKSGSYKLQIFDGQLLTVRFCDVAQIEVFSPTGQRVVCTAKGNEHSAVVKQKSDGRHLRVSLGNNIIDIEAGTHILKTCAIQHAIHQKRGFGQKRGFFLQQLSVMGLKVHLTHC